MKKIAACITTLSLLAMGELLPFGAQAQYVDFSLVTSPVTNIGLATVGTSSMESYKKPKDPELSLGKALTTARNGQPEASDDAEQADVLEFKTSDQVKQETNREIIAVLSQRIPDPAAMSVLENAINADLGLKDFDVAMVRAGFDSHNMADVMAAYMLTTWEIINDADSDPYPQGVQAVRSRVRHAMGNNPLSAKLSDAEKQRQAQILAYEIVLNNAVYLRLKEDGNTELLHKLKSRLQADTETYGIDLTKIDLTNQGFVSR